MCDVTFREAGDGDAGSILSIDAGTDDYLPAYLPYYMAHADYTCIVSELASEIVGFVVMWMDDNTTVVLRAARVSGRVRGRGIYRAMEKHCVQLARRRGCSRKVISVDDTNPFFMSGRLLQAHRELCRKPYLMSRVHPGVTLPDPVDHGTPVDTVTARTLEACITDTNIRGYLFPNDVINVDDFPYAAVASNVPKLYGRQTVLYANVSTVNGHVTGLLSAGTSFCTDEHCYTIDLFGNDVKAIERHVVEHLNQCGDNWSDNRDGICLCIQYTNDGRMTAEIKDIFSRMGLQIREGCEDGGCTVVLEEMLL